MDVFKWYEKEFDPKINPKLYECIIENGFNIFILINIFIEKGTEIKNDELKEFINEMNLLGPDKGILSDVTYVISTVFTGFKEVLMGILKCKFCCRKGKYD
jgi:hypothetical protein